MTATHTAPRKAISVLKITGGKAKTGLLDLPRELRDGKSRKDLYALQSGPVVAAEAEICPPYSI